MQGIYFIAFIKGIIIAIILAFSIGPVVISLLRYSVNYGKKGGFFFIIGVNASDLTWVVLSQVFYGSIQSLLLYKRTIGIICSVLLIGVGLYFIFKHKSLVREPLATLDDQMKIGKFKYLQLFIAGYLMNLLNPAVIGIWVVLSSSLISYSLTYRLIALGTCIVSNAIFDTTKVILSQKLSKKMTDKNIRLLNLLAGVGIVFFGLLLILASWIKK
ncbi:MAG: LysE family transporter [Phycisphaerales bacterium]|nr:LysE family transporter [Phycisphaerales bacterium]